MRMGSIWLRLIIVEMYAIVFFMSELLVVDWYVLQSGIHTSLRQILGDGVCFVHGKGQAMQGGRATCIRGLDFHRVHRPFTPCLFTADSVSACQPFGLVPSIHPTRDTFDLTPRVIAPFLPLWSSNFRRPTAMWKKR
jgi:hypothetical protein